MSDETCRHAAGDVRPDGKITREEPGLPEERDEDAGRRLKELRAAVRAGIEDYERGEYYEYATARDVADDIKKDGRKRIEASTEK